MFTIMAKEKTFYFSLLLAAFVCVAGELVAEAGPRSGVPGTPGGVRAVGSPIEGVWDPAKYISIDEIQPGMEAYCLTCYKGTEIEKFGLNVISVVRNIEPDRDAILVQGTDERFIQTGPVAGCSGSPVYIEGRLAGAIAFAWFFSKDPLYGVTPIEEMLRVGQAKSKRQDTEYEIRDTRYAFDFSKPIDFAEIDKQLLHKNSKFEDRRSKIVSSSFKQLPCPLIVSGLSAKAYEQLDALAEPFGLMAVSGIGGSVDVNQGKDMQLVPGAVLTVPL